MKERFLIKGLAGKKTLSGSIAVRGGKNEVLSLMAAALLIKAPIEFDNVPEIEDIKRIGELYAHLGVTFTKSAKDKYLIDASVISNGNLDKEIAKRFRASIVLAGPLLARLGHVSFPHPGGDVIGERPIDIFLDGFQKMGAVISERDGSYCLVIKEKKLQGMEYFFKIISVTATKTFMMAAVLAEGTTVLRNAAMEPDVATLAELLTLFGAKITGAGTPTIIIEGGELSNVPQFFTIPPDRLETGSFLILGALAADTLEITHCRPSEVMILVDMLTRSGVPITVNKDSILIKGNGKIKNHDLLGMNVRTHEYPGFPTDLQAPMTVYLSQVKGESLVFETVFEGRLNYVHDLVRMGADIAMWNPHQVMVRGPKSLIGHELESPDIRAGLAYVIAAIVAKGDSVINNVYHIDRGYEEIEKRFRAIGVDIERVK
jgi:UDP-N-acetylglucosamine 1-carboxyvinyltransferase